MWKGEKAAEFFRWLCWYGAINGLIAAGFSASLVNMQDLVPGAALFLGLALPGHFLFLAALVALPCGLLWLLTGSKRAASWLAIALFSCALILVYLDHEVFRIYRFHLDSMVWNLITGGAASQMLAFSSLMWVVSAALVCAIVLAQALLARFLARRPLPRARRLLVMGALVMFSGQIFYAWSDASGNTRVTSQLRYIPWAQPVTAKSFFKRFGISAEQGVDIAGNIEGKLDYPKSPLSCAAVSPPNILVLMVDSLRFDMLNAEVMPNSTAFARESLNYQRHYSVANATRFGVFSFFYGLPGSYWFSMLGEHRGAVLISALKNRGYEFFLYGAAPLNSPEFDRTIFADLPSEDLRWPKEKAPGAVKDRYLADQMIQYLKREDRQKPFFGFLFFDAPHGFSIPENGEPAFKPVVENVNYLALDNDYDPEPFFNLYKSSVHYNDQLIGEILGTLREQGLLENTIVMITGDHGQEFNESGKNFWGHNGNFSDWQARVPMVIHWPGETAQEISGVSTHMDVAPTLLKNVLGCANPPADYSTGMDMLQPLPAERAVLFSSWSRKAIRHADLIYQFERYGGGELYDENYTPVPARDFDNQFLLQALDDMGAFHKH